ncbi:MAG TPA: sugar phosphate isomerase/epimerase [Armatimonadota bacterium]|nr:sugar phosphate isomerase/epimerase [Armatimonadota bacterium]
MRVGIDTFTIRELGLDPIQQLDYIRNRGFEGAQFGALGTDVGRLREIRAHADALGLYSHVSVLSPNPYFGETSRAERVQTIRQQIEAAAECGWHELHSLLGGEDTRYRDPVPWPTHLADSSELIRELAPVLRAHGSRIDLETHGEVTTFELVRIAEDVGPDVAGICLDTANVLIFGEDPVAAARRAAPYTHLTHAKDAILYFSDRGVTRQGRPPGEGIVDWGQILPILAEHEPDLPLSIEDHKWLFGAWMFESDWLAEQGDLSRDELAEFVRLAWDCQRRIESGELPPPDEYEEIPYLGQIEDRLASAREYFHGLLARMDCERS